MSYRFSTTQSLGFSFPEMMIAVGIVVTLAALSWKPLVQFTNFHAVDKEAGVLISTLAYARSQSMSGKNDIAYGVHFTNTSITIFRGATYLPGAITNVVRTFNGGAQLSAIMLTGSAVDVIFDKLTGAASATGTLELSSSRDSAQKRTITIFATGLVQ